MTTDSPSFTEKRMKRMAFKVMINNHLVFMWRTAYALASFLGPRVSFIPLHSSNCLRYAVSCTCMYIPLKYVYSNSLRMFKKGKILFTSSNRSHECVQGTQHRVLQLLLHLRRSPSAALGVALLVGMPVQLVRAQSDFTERHNSKKASDGVLLWGIAYRKLSWATLTLIL